jgi:predicted nucleic acid-binding protein
MDDIPAICVIDANVALKLFLEQPGSDRACALFSRLTTDPAPRFFVPDFFYAECSSVLAKTVRLTKGYAAIDARRDNAALCSLALKAVPTLHLAAEAIDIALDHGISAYDAFYVALSRRVGAPLITADAKLARALSGKGFDVQPLDQGCAPSALPAPSRRTRGAK